MAEMPLGFTILHVKFQTCVLIQASQPHPPARLTVTSCAGGRHNMPTPPANWPLTFWPWNWYPSHMWRGLPLCQFQSS